jgi:hypothetical protein
MRALALATVLALAISACAQSPQANRPSEPVATPSDVPATIAPQTPSPTLSPSPEPTVVPPIVETPMPRPTTRKAGEQMYAYYFEARRQFPIFPPTPQIDFDEPADANGNSWFHGLNPSGQPIFTVREDYVMTPRTAYHEIGHAYEALLLRKDPSNDILGKYWTFRGFAGTWQDAMRSSAAQTSFMAQWATNPHEMWAESFSFGMVGASPGVNAVAMKSFFKSLLPAP